MAENELGDPHFLLQNFYKQDKAQLLGKLKKF